MVALIVIGIILLVIVAIGLIRATVYLSYRDEVRLSVSVAGIRFGILPKKEKKVNYKKFTPRYFRKKLKKKQKEEEKRRLKKQQRYEKKQAKKKARAEEKKKRLKELSRGGHPEEKATFIEKISLVRELLSIFFSRFGKHFRIKVARINITVASDDAAKTAIMYGVCAQSVAYILEILDNATNLDYNKNAEVNLEVDYLAEKPSADIDLAFSLRVWHLFDILVRVALGAAKSYVNKK